MGPRGPGHGGSPSPDWGQAGPRELDPEGQLERGPDRKISVGDGGRGWDTEEASWETSAFAPSPSRSGDPRQTMACGPCTAPPLQKCKSWAQSCKQCQGRKDGLQPPPRRAAAGAQGTLAAVLAGITHAVTQTSPGLLGGWEL